VEGAGVEGKLLLGRPTMKKLFLTLRSVKKSHKNPEGKKTPLPLQAEKREKRGAGREIKETGKGPAWGRRGQPKKESGWKTRGGTRKQKARYGRGCE